MSARVKGNLGWSPAPLFLLAAAMGGTLHFDIGVANRKHMDDVLELMESGRLHSEQVITEFVDWDEVAEGLA